MIRALALSLALASPAGAFELAFPAGCILGQNCYIQQFSDHDPGPAATDFTCGPLSYDGHDGTDIALPTRKAMEQGVPVLAAAAGTVVSTRDGIADFAPFPPGKDCGNGVVINHPQGWQTQYCHLKQGSIAVFPGQSVATATRLGEIGQSGRAEFPHLHLTLRHNGQTVDPFAPIAQCGGKQPQLWDIAIPYRPGGLLGIGLAPEIPDYAAIKSGLSSPDLPANAPALVAWAYVFAPRPGDALLFEITGPEGFRFTERSVFERPQALAFRASGKKRGAENWPLGRYKVTVRMLRDGKEIGQQSLTVTVNAN